MSPQKRHRYSYDSEAMKLADYFLVGEPDRIIARREDLAQHIQEAVETWLEEANRQPEPPAVNPVPIMTADM